MALSPVITGTTSNKCKTLSVTDTTGVYNVTTNPEGWGAPNDDGSAMTIANITITYADGGIQVVDVLSQIPASVTGNFTFADITLTGYVDGITTITYDLTATSIDYSSQISLLLSCDVRACLDKMWATVACKTCAGSCDVGELIDDANFAEGLYMGLTSGSTCCGSECVNNIINALKDLCAFNTCNC